MAHLVESMMYVGEVPWHGLGVEVKGLATSQEALEKAGLNWDIARTSVFTNGDEVNGYKAITRTSDGKVLSIMKDSYRPHAPRECFRFFDEVVGDKLAMYETAGSLRGGKTIWMLASIPGEIRVPGTDDVILKKVLLATSFDGTLATIVKNTPTRVVCWNTLNQALGGGVDLKVRHRQDLDSQVIEARRLLGIISKQYEAVEVDIVRLAGARFSESQMKGLAADLFPANQETGEVGEAAVAHRSALLDLFEYGKGQEMVRGTAWAAFNAVTEWTDHVREHREGVNGSPTAARLNSTWFGPSAAMKQQAMSYIDTALAA